MPKEKDKYNTVVVSTRITRELYAAIERELPGVREKTFGRVNKVSTCLAYLAERYIKIQRVRSLREKALMTKEESFTVNTLASVVEDTQDEILVELDPGEVYWIPKKEIAGSSEVWEDEDVGTLVVTKKFADKMGWE